MAAGRTLHRRSSSCRMRPPTPAAPMSSASATVRNWRWMPAKTVDTGNIDANKRRANSALRPPPTYAGFYGQGGWFHYEIDRRTALPNPHFSGWYGILTYSLTGEQHPYDPTTASFRNAAARPSAGHAGRLGRLGDRRRATATSIWIICPSTARPPAVSPAASRMSGRVGLNWYPNTRRQVRPGLRQYPGQPRQRACQRYFRQRHRAAQPDFLLRSKDDEAILSPDRAAGLLIGHRGAGRRDLAECELRPDARALQGSRRGLCRRLQGRQGHDQHLQWRLRRPGARRDRWACRPTS